MRFSCVYFVASILILSSCGKATGSNMQSFDSDKFNAFMESIADHWNQLAENKKYQENLKIIRYSDVSTSSLKMFDDRSFVIDHFTVSKRLLSKQALPALAADRRSLRDVMDANHLAVDKALDIKTSAMVQASIHNFVTFMKNHGDSSFALNANVDCRAANGAALGCEIANGVSCALVTLPGPVRAFADVACAVTSVCGAATSLTLAVGYCRQTSNSNVFTVQNGAGTVPLNSFQTNANMRQSNTCTDGSNCQNVGGNVDLGSGTMMFGG